MIGIKTDAEEGVGRGADLNFKKFMQNQTILDIYSAILQESGDESGMKLARIKQLFYERKYSEIFMDVSLVPVYATFYSPSRSLCYFSIFSSKNILPLLSKSIYCLGSGNAAELVGILAAIHPTNASPHIHCQDMSDYKVIDSIFNYYSTNYSDSTFSKPTLSQSISNLLDCNDDVFQNIHNSTLVTAMFLLNELFITDKSRFVVFFKKLVSSMKPGSYLLCVDSAGSFSEFTGSKTGNVYMIYKLFDNLPTQFEVIEKTDSQWYRIPKDLKYPLKLNNMRYFMRLYRRI